MERKIKLQITGMEKKYKNGDGVENINIEITLTGSGYKVLCFSDGRDPDLSLRHHGYHSFKNKCY